MVFSFLSSALVKRISLGTMRFYFWEMLKSNLNSPKHFFFSLFFYEFSDSFVSLEMLRCTLYRNTKPWIMSSEIYCTFLHSLASRDLLCLCLSFSLCASFSLTLSCFLFLYLCTLWEKIMQWENTYNSLFDCKTTLMCTTVNSLWLNNLPFSQTFQRGGWKLCIAILENEGEWDDP